MMMIVPNIQAKKKVKTAILYKFFAQYQSKKLAFVNSVHDTHSNHKISKLF